MLYRWKGVTCTNLGWKKGYKNSLCVSCKLKVEQAERAELAAQAQRQKALLSKKMVSSSQGTKRKRPRLEQEQEQVGITGNKHSCTTAAVNRSDQPPPQEKELVKPTKGKSLPVLLGTNGANVDWNRSFAAGSVVARSASEDGAIIAATAPPVAKVNAVCKIGGKVVGAMQPVHLCLHCGDGGCAAAAGQMAACALCKDGMEVPCRNTTTGQQMCCHCRAVYCAPCLEAARGQTPDPLPTSPKAFWMRELGIQAWVAAIGHPTPEGFASRPLPMRQAQVDTKWALMGCAEKELFEKKLQTAVEAVDIWRNKRQSADGHEMLGQEFIDSELGECVVTRTGNHESAAVLWYQSSAGGSENFSSLKEVRAWVRGTISVEAWHGSCTSCKRYMCPRCTPVSCSFEGCKARCCKSCENTMDNCGNCSSAFCAAGDCNFDHKKDCMRKAGGIATKAMGNSQHQKPSNMSVSASVEAAASCLAGIYKHNGFAVHQEVQAMYNGKWYDVTIDRIRREKGVEVYIVKEASSEWEVESDEIRPPPTYQKEGTKKRKR
jgi:hypothetical protein